jgi:hypothetical protein
MTIMVPRPQIVMMMSAGVAVASSPSHLTLSIPTRLRKKLITPKVDSYIQAQRMVVPMEGTI